ncbi:MAG: hypothetical protein D6728_02300 [Cyanobacteria bacterium J055]|nr:MAG: hypothetical protein D6728_02300 [Cyanobacteria bacterium J055]
MAISKIKDPLYKTTFRFFFHLSRRILNLSFGYFTKNKSWFCNADLRSRFGKVPNFCGDRLKI